MNLSQLALVKFQHGVGKIDVSCISAGCLIKDCQCCEWGNLLITILKGGEVWEVVALAKARSGLVLVFHLVEWKEQCCMES